MKQKFSFLKIVPLLLFFYSCDHSENKKLIIGSWSGVEWLVEGKPGPSDPLTTRFTFNEKEEYSYENSGVVEKGTYKIEKDKLYTTPAGEQEIMVRISKLTGDSLIFDMNRGGRPETLTLLRQ